MNVFYRGGLKFGGFQKLLPTRFVERHGKVAKLLCLISFLLTMAHASRAALPQGWSDADIGSPGLAGSAGYTNGGWTVTGGGADIWSASDQFNFASTLVSGDGTSLPSDQPAKQRSQFGMVKGRE